jgi:hypothetical protein
VSGFSGLKVDEPVGPRWELALALIDSGEAPVMLGSVELWRATSGPKADGVISVVVRSSTPVPTAGAARAEVELARANVKAATVADPRLGNLLDRYGSRWEFVDDYGVLLAHIDSDGYLAWEPRRRPT